MNLKNLSDEELLRNTESAAADERAATTRLLHHLCEIQTRRLYVYRGCDSLFTYCVRILKMSEPQAARRVNAARLIKELPSIEDKINSGTLTLTAVSQAQVFFKRESRGNHALGRSQKEELLSQLEHRSTRQVDQILAARSFEPAIHITEKQRPVSSTHTEVKLILDNETLDDLQRLREIWAHSLPNVNLSAVIKKMAHLCRAQHDPSTKPAQVSASTPAQESRSRTRYIPQNIKILVWKRDQGCCSYVDPESGQRCGSRTHIQFDHIKAFAIGGAHSTENLRLRCHAHNQWHAIKTFGTAVLNYSKGS